MRALGLGSSEPAPSARGQPDLHQMRLSDPETSPLAPRRIEQRADPSHYDHGDEWRQHHENLNNNLADKMDHCANILIASMMICGPRTANAMIARTGHAIRIAFIPRWKLA